MKRMKRGLCLMLATLMVALLTACGSPEKEIRHLTENFCDSYNHLDIEGMTACLEPNLARLIDAAFGMTMGLMGEALGADLDIDPQLLYDLITVYMDIAPADDELLQALREQPTIEIELGEIELYNDEEEAVAQAIVTIEAGGSRQQTEGVLYYTKEDGEWYISNRNFALEG